MFFIFPIIAFFLLLLLAAAVVISIQKAVEAYNKHGLPPPPPSHP